MSNRGEEPGSEKILLSWSSGKDSAWCLEVLRREARAVAGLFTTFDEASGTVAMHGVPLDVARRQAEACGLELTAIPLPWPCPNEIYEARMGAFCESVRENGATQLAFGDLFLEEIRAYREAKLAGSGIAPIFPVWDRDTGMLAREMIAGGLIATIVCLDPKKMPREALGRRFDLAFLDALPDSVDPCGENGEFHTLVTDGPMFRSSVVVLFDDVVERGGFLYLDVNLA